MSNFIYNSYCVEHPGVVHVYQAADDRKSAAKRFSGKRGASALLLAALVAALMVVVNEVAHNWTDGHMLGDFDPRTRDVTASLPSTTR